MEEWGREGLPDALSERVADASSRKRFLQLVGVGAAGALTVLATACGDEGEEKTGPGAPADEGGEDLDIVNYALLLELIEADFYRRVNDSGQVTKSEYVELFTSFELNEEEHAEALTATVRQLGGTPVALPRTKFDPVIEGGEEEILRTAATIENLGASAYLGQADKIQQPDILDVALSIHTVEARHAAALNDLAGTGFRGDGKLSGAIPNGAFAKARSMREVLALVKPFVEM